MEVEDAVKVEPKSEPNSLSSKVGYEKGGYTVLPDVTRNKKSKVSECGSSMKVKFMYPLSRNSGIRADVALITNLVESPSIKLNFRCRIPVSSLRSMMLFD